MSAVIAGGPSGTSTTGTSEGDASTTATSTADASRASGAVASGAVAADARAVRRSFGGREVLRGVDLQIAEGEFVALLGRSGSGKSTLLRILAGLDAGAGGDVQVPPRRSVVFQDARLLPWARVLDNVVLGQGGRAARDRGREVLAEVGLGGHERDWPKTLSGGEAQRAALARALVRDPQLLLLDEPFGALDALTRVRMHTLVQQLHRRYRAGVLLVTHDVDEAVLLADRVLVLTDGRISLDEHVGLAGPRLRTDPAFAALRSRLLRELGVDEAAEGDHDTATGRLTDAAVSDRSPHTTPITGSPT